MTQKKRIQWIWAVVAGALLGAVLGNAIGASIHSDNLPFFGALGAVVGMGLGFMLFWVANCRTGWRPSRLSLKADGRLKS